MTHRSPNVHEGNTWGIPGGAMDQGELPHEAALRETEEELGVYPQVQNIRTIHSNDHGGWAYHTVAADVPEAFQPQLGGWETTHAGWYTPQEISQLPLHSGFAQTWDRLQNQRESLADAFRQASAEPDDHA